ncbi:hypothetical protein ASG49_16285 [Marmoricola sp. Leaf446]|uniref:hypothetical protein n=1 Tax=Marmoricola sp. Leaf446 TaxID=1736379 RepID=UPI0006F6EAD4|nr:hypothetical protein [Marmoricola sp. Leaf446]KQT89336.1 hypothetical protein ASG49_16285 [Marmoricola sp. Leaf446]
MTRTSTRLLAAGGAVVLTALAAAPATAATVVSRADANALTVSIAGNGQGTGTAGATYDGQESRTGETQPSPSPFSQDFVDLGVLTQQATAGDGFSAACAGVAGAGGGIVQIGDGSCLTPGDTVTGSLSSVDLAGLGLEPPEQLPLPDGLGALLDTLGDGRGQLDGILRDALGQVDEAVGPLGLTLRFDAIEGRCRVDGGSPSGTASLANAALVLSGGGRDVKVVDIPANPAPNTEVTTDLSEVVALVLDAASTQLREGLDEATGPLADAIDPVRDQIVAQVRSNLDGQLEPLRDTLLSVTLNEQSRPTSDSIRVSALHAQVLPAAAGAVGASLADVRVGNANCGPADRVPTEAAPAPAPKQAVPELPTAVSAGVEGPATTTLSARLAQAAPLTGVALAGLLIAIAGVLGVRRHLG